jgi:hypothetical protein
MQRPRPGAGQRRPSTSKTAQFTDNIAYYAQGAANLKAMAIAGVDTASVYANAPIDTDLSAGQGESLFIGPARRRSICS